MIETLRQICKLQPKYSPENTAEMRERGRLIRHVLPEELRAIQPELRAALGKFGEEFDVGASDGMGRKTEAPWTRFFARSMAPTPRDGFYVVLHFAADGSAVFITLGCGSTIWANGELRSVSDSELAERTGWARRIIEERFGSIQPFADEISLGAKAPLPSTFEKATAIAKRLPIDDLEEPRLRELLVQAAERLSAVYEAQRIGRYIKAGEVLDQAVESVFRPERAQAIGQGFRLSAEERRAIESRAMLLAKNWLESNGFVVADRSKTSSFDYEATKGTDVFKIEVKGTTNQRDAIFMTKNEVDLHISECGKTGIIIVSDILLETKKNKPIAKGGSVYVDLGWDIRTWNLVPMAFKVTRSVIC